MSKKHRPIDEHAVVLLMSLEQQAVIFAGQRFDTNDVKPAPAQGRVALEQHKRSMASNPSSLGVPVQFHGQMKNKSGVRS
jgi:hypothetical protein